MIEVSVALVHGIVRHGNHVLLIIHADDNSTWVSVKVTLTLVYDQPLRINHYLSAIGVNFQYRVSVLRLVSFICSVGCLLHILISVFGFCHLSRIAVLHT